MIVPRRRVHSRRRRDHRRRRVGGRVGDHRRVGAGHPRIGRRSVGGHRRHARPLRLDQGAHHLRPGPDLSRSDDRARRRRRAAEDAERDRAQHPARRADDRLPDRGRDAAAVRDLLGRAADAVRPDLAAGLPDSDDDRRPAVGDRHRRMDRLVQHNVLAMSGRAVEAAGDVHTLLLDKTGTITLGNRQATEFVPRRGRDRCGAGRRRAAGVAGRRDAGRALDRRPREGEISHPRPRAGRQVGGVRPVLPRRRACPASTSTAARSGRAPPTRSPPTSKRTAEQSPPSCTRSSTGSRAPAARRWSSPNGHATLGVIHLKDIVKGGMRQRFDALRAMGIKTVMITGRQPADRRVDRQGSGRRRLPGPGDAGRQDGAHQARAGRRQAGRDDRRRHQRRAGAGAGRRRAWR